MEGSELAFACCSGSWATCCSWLFCAGALGWVMARGTQHPHALQSVFQSSSHQLAETLSDFPSLLHAPHPALLSIIWSSRFSILNAFQCLGDNFSSNIVPVSGTVIKKDSLQEDSRNNSYTIDTAIIDVQDNMLSSHCTLPSARLLASGAAASNQAQRSSMTNSSVAGRLRFYYAFVVKT